jgi:hypothetical protein
VMLDPESIFCDFFSAKIRFPRKLVFREILSF